MISIDEINKLKAENAKLNAIIDSYQPRLQALKDEKDKYYQQTLDDEIKINELYEENELLRETIKTWQYSDGQHMLKINKLEQKLDDILDFCISKRNDFCKSNCSRKYACEKRNCFPIRSYTHIINTIKEQTNEK